MKRSQLVAEIKSKQSFLCVGLDTDLNKIPVSLRKEKNPILAFNKAVIEATHDLCVAYKPNLAFYEAYGSKGLEALEATMDLIPENTSLLQMPKEEILGTPLKSMRRPILNKWGSIL